MSTINSPGLADATRTSNRLTRLLLARKQNLLAIYYTAGFPQLDSTVTIARYLEQASADIIEIGMPFSDPIADGPVIQQSSAIALRNGMTIGRAIEQVRSIREQVSVPILLMGYFNPVLQYGLERFCREAAGAGVDGVVLPDLPLREYQREYRDNFVSNKLSAVFLIAPSTSDERIRQIDKASDGFVYAVSSAATTGTRNELPSDLDSYLSRLRSLELRNPWLVGFGISDWKSFRKVCEFGSGAIVGSAFVKMLETSVNLESDVQDFVDRIRVQAPMTDLTTDSQS